MTYQELDAFALKYAYTLSCIKPPEGSYVVPEIPTLMMGYHEYQRTLINIREIANKINNHDMITEDGDSNTIINFPSGAKLKLDF